jgi:hypothetical protein
MRSIERSAKLTVRESVRERLCATQQAGFIKAFVHVHAALDAVENRSVSNGAEVFRDPPQRFFGGHPLYRIKSRETHRT